MKQIPTFLIAHSKESRDKNNFIICTKGISFLARIIDFDSETQLNEYLNTTIKLHRKLDNRLTVIELHEYFCRDNNEKSANRMLDRMVTWYLSYGEERA